MDNDADSHVQSNGQCHTNPPAAEPYRHGYTQSCEAVAAGAAPTDANPVADVDATSTDANRHTMATYTNVNAGLPVVRGASRPGDQCCDSG
jgi:hypothetical protein